MIAGFGLGALTALSALTALTALAPGLNTSPHAKAVAREGFLS